MADLCQDLLLHTLAHPPSLNPPASGQGAASSLHAETRMGQPGHSQGAQRRVPSVEVPKPSSKALERQPAPMQQAAASLRKGCVCLLSPDSSRMQVAETSLHCDRPGFQVLGRCIVLRVKPVGALAPESPIMVCCIVQTQCLAVRHRVADWGGTVAETQRRTVCSGPG